MYSKNYATLKMRLMLTDSTLQVMKSLSISTAQHRTANQWQLHSIHAAEHETATAAIEVLTGSAAAVDVGRRSAVHLQTAKTNANKSTKLVKKILTKVS